MKFDWDEKKAAENLRKHGVSFYEAITVFEDPWFFDLSRCAALFPRATLYHYGTF
jgi:uncharacterized DUF497 family protein